MSIDRKNDLINSIASEYVKITNQASTKDIINIRSTINIVCGGQCKTCLQTFIDPVVLAKGDAATLETVATLGGSTGGLYQPNPNGPCYNLCTCEVDDVILKNIVLLKEVSEITDKDTGKLKQIADNVYNLMVQKYGNEYSNLNNTKRISEIVLSITKDSTTNIQQLLTTIQEVDIQGFGTMKAMDLTLGVNAVYKAIVDNSDAMLNISDVVQDMITSIKKDVDKDFMDGFTYIWEEGKSYFIGAGIFLVVLFVIMIVLLMYKASR